MNQQRPLEDLPRPGGVEVLQREDEGDSSREENGTGANADKEQLGTDDEELDELEDDAEGG